jgi:hypothetical protein
METPRPTTGHERAMPGIGSAADGGCFVLCDSVRRLRKSGAIGTDQRGFENLISGLPYF